MPTSQPNFVSEFGQTAIDQLANQESSLQPNQSNCSVNGGGEGIGTFHYEQSQYNDRQTQNNNKHYVFIDQHQRQFQNGQQQQSQVSSVSVNHAVQNQIQNPGQQQNPGPLQSQGHFQNQIARQTYHPSSSGDYYDYPQMMDTNVQSTIENVPQFPYHNQHLTNMSSSILPDSISNGFSNNFTAQHPKKSTYEWYNIQNDHVSSSPGIPAAPSSANMASSSSSSGQGGHSRTSSTNTAGSEMQDLSKPKVATTFWEDENTVCYQVFARKVLVSRREDTDFINGTKLLNVIGMSRGKRDGMLKSEKTRSVVKVGSMNLKGVWIPFERAYEIARNEGIDVLLHPLFVKNLKDFYRTEGYKLRSDDAGVLTSPVEDVSSQEDASKMQSSSSISESLNAPIGGIASVIGGSVLYGHSPYSPSSHAPTFKPDLTKEGALAGTNSLATSELISIRETSGALDAEQLVQHTEFESSSLNQAKQQKFTYYTHQAAVAESSRIP